MSARVKVFVSSATGQLAQYRAAVIEALRRFNCEPVFMEDFIPDRATPSEYCRARVAECDVVVVLLGHRYGSLVPGEDRSFTELEYDTALAVPDRRLMVWVVDEAHPWLPSEIDQGDARSRLVLLKERARQHIVGTFGPIGKFREDLAFAFADLQHHADGAHGASEVASAVRLRMPRRPEIAAFPRYVGNMAFTGRAAENRWLDEWARSSDCLAVVEAIGGTGKSALTWDWFTNGSPHAIDDLAGRFWWSFYEGTNSMRKFQQTLLLYCTGCSQEAAEALDPVALADSVLTALEQRRYLVVLDGFERLLNAYHRFDASAVTDAEVDELHLVYARAMTDPAAHDFMRRLTKVQMSRVLISTRLLPDAFVGFGDILVPGVRHTILPGLRTEDTRTLLTKLGLKYSYAQAETFFDRLDNHPLLIGVVAGLVNNYRSAPGDFDAWLADPREGGRFSVATMPISTRSHHIFEQALAGLDPMSLQVLQRISVPGGATTWDMLQVINPFLPTAATRPAEWSALPAYLSDHLWERRRERRDSELGDPRIALTRLDAALRELQDRGLLWWNHEANTYDLHPVVRAFTLETISDEERKATNERLVRDHFGRLRDVKDPKAAHSVEDLLPTIQMFRALTGSGDLARAEALWRGRLSDSLVFRLGASVVVTQLLEEFVTIARVSAHETTLNWDLAIAELTAGYLERAIDRQRALLARSLARDDDPTAVLSGLNNLVVDAEELLQSASVSRYVDLMTALTEVAGSPGDVARLNHYRADALLDAERDEEALEAVRELQHGPPNPLDPYWQGTLLALEFEALDRLGRGGEIGSVRVGDGRFGPATIDKLRWARFVISYAERRTDFALAHEAALAADYWTRRLGRESLPVDVAWALAGLDRAYEAAELLEAALVRFDRIHFALRPHFGAARALTALGRVDEAAPHAVAAYRQSWRDGPPTEHARGVRRAAELLDRLGIKRPDLPSVEPATADVPLAGEISDYIDRLRVRRSDGPLG